jgi:hypothetical protein
MQLYIILILLYFSFKFSGLNIYQNLDAIKMRKNYVQFSMPEGPFKQTVVGGGKQVLAYLKTVIESLPSLLWCMHNKFNNLYYSYIGTAPFFSFCLIIEGTTEKLFQFMM